MKIFLECPEHTKICPFFRFMFGPLLRETTIIIIFCNIFVESQDFLEYYKPKPGLPRELNEWLKDVQQYKGDFRLIRAIAKKHEEGGLDYDVEALANTNTKLLGDLEEESEYLDEEAPRNDIYPHMYKQKHSPYENLGTSFDVPGNKQKKYASRNLRQRRHSRDKDIDVNPKSDDGEIKRSDDKYPDRFFNGPKNNANKKREIQIDVLNDGKLVKQIRENDRDPKSIVLNIQSLDKFKNPPPPYKPEAIATEIEANQVKSSDSQVELSDTQSVISLNSQIKPMDSQAKLFPAQRNADSETYTTNNKELSNNFKNLFNVNENLNTDSSIARDKLAGQTALLYRVTLPDTDNFFIADQDKITIKEDDKGGFNHNGMKDMSRFWTATEKNQMQKGIEYARGNWNGMPLQTSQQAFDGDGFELVKSVVMDSDNVRGKYKPNPGDESSRQNKRESQTIEGRVRINAAEEVNKNSNDVYNAGSSKGPLDNNIPVNEERKDNSERKTTTPNVPLMIDSQTGNNIMEAAIESIKTMDEHSDDDQRGNLNVPLDGNSLKDNSPQDSLIDDRLDDNLKKVEDMADADVNELIPKEYRETTPEFIIPAPEDESVHNIEDVGVRKNEQVENVEDTKVNLDNQQRFNVNQKRLEDEGLGSDETYGNGDRDTKGEILVNFPPQEEKLQDVCWTTERIDGAKDHHQHRGHSKHHHAEFLPITKIHKIDQDIQDHLIATRIETITILNEEQNTEDEEDEDTEEKGQSSEGNEHEVEILVKPLSRPRKKETERLYLNRAPPERMKTNRLLVKSRQCKGGNCAEKYENGKQKVEQKHLKHRKNKHKHRKHKNYRDKIRYNTGRDEIDEFFPNDQDDIPAFGRHLQEVEYVYDVDMGPEEESLRDVREASSTDRDRKIGVLHKNSLVEGDYGDEEDSITKDKKEKSKLVKKTDNEFANPVVTTTEADDDDEDYYDESADESEDVMLTDDKELASFGRRYHKQTKSPKKEGKKKKVGKRVRDAGDPPSQKFLDKSEFQRWPQFVISDKINEENLRKRSLAIKKIEPRANIFPLSSKDYFTKSNPKRQDSLQLDGAFPTPGISTTTEKLFADVDKPKKTDMEVKLNLNLNMDDRFQKPDEVNGITFFPVSGIPTTSNQSVASTEEECDDTVKVSVGNVCEENENFNKTKVVLTTVLSIIPDAQGEITNETYNAADDFVTLDDILSGHLPFRILEYIQSHVKKDKVLKNRFLRGMKKSHGEETFQNLPDITNEESKKLINAMSSLMSRLQITSTCQTLPGKLLWYLKSATRVRLEDTLARAKEMEEVEFDDIQNQDNFIFQSNSRADNLEEKVRVLKDLLMKYNHLPERCKPRAEPVREYVQNHLKLLTNMLSEAQVLPPRPKKTLPDQASEELKSPPEKRTNEKDLVEEQLESLGLGNQHNFRPKFSLDELIQHNRIAKEMSVDQAKLRSDPKKKNKRDLDREEISEKYEKLREAVKRQRSKRDSEKKVAENFGRLSIDDYNGEGLRGEGTGNFESPLVFSF